MQRPDGRPCKNNCSTPRAPVPLPRGRGRFRSSWFQITHAPSCEYVHTHTFSYVCTCLYIWAHVCLCVYMLLLPVNSGDLKGSRSFCLPWNFSSCPGSGEVGVLGCGSSQVLWDVCFAHWKVVLKMLSLSRNSPKDALHIRNSGTVSSVSITAEMDPASADLGLAVCSRHTPVPGCYPCPTLSEARMAAHVLVGARLAHLFLKLSRSSLDRKQIIAPFREEDSEHRVR